MEPKPFIIFFLGFVVSIGYYRLFFTINRPVVRWRFFAMFAVIVLSRLICTAWQFYVGHLQEQNVIANRMGGFFINLLSLLACVFLGSNRLRAFVAASFVLCTSYVAYIPVIYTSAFVLSLIIKFDFFDKLPKTPQDFNVMIYLFCLNLIIMLSCFLSARWLHKTQEKPPLKICFYFGMFFIFFALLMSIFLFSTWIWKIMVFTPFSSLGVALVGILLVCILNIAMYFFSWLTFHRELVSEEKEEPTNIQGTSCAGYAQYIGQLSKRELEVIEAVLAGNVSQKELAASLNISVNTVKKHLQHIYQTTGTANMTALTVLFSGYSNNNPLRLKDTNMAC